MNNIRFFSVILYGKLLKNKTYEVHLHCKEDFEPYEG